VIVGIGWTGVVQLDDECGQGLWYLEQRDRAGLGSQKMKPEEMYGCRFSRFGKPNRDV
jgi:hypothetical protein